MHKVACILISRWLNLTNNLNKFSTLDDLFAIENELHGLRTTGPGKTETGYLRISSVVINCPNSRNVRLDQLAQCVCALTGTRTD